MEAAPLHQVIEERNWVVIRFSELQVVKYPDACCKAIGRVICQITGDYRSLVKLQNVKNSLPHQQWKVKQAVYMAKAKFRNSYLKIIFIDQGIILRFSINL